MQACAHRYKKLGASYLWGLGICMSMTNDLDMYDYWEPCGAKPKSSGHGQYGFCQAGTSTAVHEVSMAMVIISVGILACLCCLPVRQTTAEP